ncbi:MAG: CheY-P-specific phosphatase CheC [Firmicutes bacterium]|nr:CheY-P-specific phosphatase CheC [Bacillota bacterium]
MGEDTVNSFKLDVLKELANIGTGNAVTSLAKLLDGEKITMEVPDAKLVPLQDIPESLGGAELPVAGVFIESTGDIQLTILFVIPLESALKIISVLLPAARGDFDALEQSALLEVGNILTSSYLTALSLMTDLLLLPSPPAIAIDMSGAIISTVMAEARVQDDELVLLQTTLNSRRKRIIGYILIIPDRGALGTIFARLGIR